MSAIRTLKRSESGIVAVEFAIFLPIFLLLIFSVVELGSAWYAKQIMINASRDGARMASLLNPGDITNADVETYVQTVLVNSGFPGAATVAATGTEGSTGDPVTVVVDATYELPVLGALVPGVIGQVNLHASTVMRHE